MLTLQNAEHDCDRLQRDQKRLTGDRDDCRKELEELSAKRDSAMAEMNRAAEERVQAEKDAEKAETAVESARQNVDSAQLRQEQQQKALRELQGEIDGAQQLVSHETERLHRQEIAQNRVKTDLSQLCDRLWDTYELSYAGAQELGQTYPEAPFKESEARRTGPFPAGADPQSGFGQCGGHRGIRPDVRTLYRPEHSEERFGESQE